MKNLTIYLILIVPVLLLSSKCVDKKNNDAENFQIIKGRLMVDCNTPYASSLVKLQSTQYGFNGPAFCEDAIGNSEFYTDENGYFEINYRKIGTEGMIFAPNKVLEWIPLSDKSLDVGEVTLSGKVNFVIKLQVNNAYTVNDTLVFKDFNGATVFDEIRISGPFSSTVIDSVFESADVELPLRYNHEPRVQLTYFLLPYVSGSVKTEYVNTPFCTSTFQEAVLIID